MSLELKGSARSRPVRVAFLVEDGEHSGTILDGIFADCYDRWGGRFSLIAPCVNGKISAAYWPWLETFDPDIVYSYVALEDAEVLNIHERLYPSRYIYRPRTPLARNDLHGFKPTYDFDILKSLSVNFRAARFTPLGAPSGPVRIVDEQYAMPSRWLTDNFGTYRTSRSTGIFPVDALSAASLLHVVDPETAKNPHIPTPKENTVPTEFAAFAEIARGRASSMSLASTILAPKIDIREDRWSHSFNLVIGDSFADRIMFWNARLLIPSWLDGDHQCFRLDEAHLQQAEFVSALGDFIKFRNHVNRGNGGQPQLTIRSCSLGADRLEAARATIAATKPWSQLHTEVVANLDAIVPSTRVLSDAREAMREPFGERPTWNEFIWTPPTLRPVAVAPDHLADAPTRQHFAEGAWMTDYSLEVDQPKPQFSMINKWQLPRRWRMARAFNISYVGGTGYALSPPPRRGRNGTLAVVQSRAHPIESIAVPTASDAMTYAFCVDGLSHGRAPNEQIYPPTKAVWTRPSNEARYLAGIIGMAGNLEDAEAFLLHPFLRDMFAKLGGATNVPIEKMRPTANSLAKRLSYAPTFDLRDEREREVLATLIVKAGKTLKAPADEIEYDGLRTDWDSYGATDDAREEDGQAADDDWTERVRASLDRCLIAMRARQMIFQGHRWSCRECHHRNWVDLSSLNPELSCEVCGKTTDAPVNIKWRFRPNEFLIESLRDHSTLSVIWTLAQLRGRSRSSFMYSPPTSFGYSDSDKPDAEADLLVVCDGNAVLCEVKASWQIVRAADVRKLVDLATRLRPDIALLSVMDEGRQLPDELERARAELEAIGIKFELMLWAPDRWRDTEFLPG